jgi:SAM-dependent methyltransferase
MTDPLYFWSKKLFKKLFSALNPRLRRHIRAFGLALFANKYYVIRHLKCVVENCSRLSAEDRAILLAVNYRISPYDTMYEGNVEAYFLCGLSALRAIEATLRQARHIKLNDILDMGCAGGRVLRFIAVRFPEATITACDINREGVDFCANALGARKVYSQPNVESLDYERAFDLIWIGSLLTNMRENEARPWIQFCEKNLKPGGILAFTTLGDYGIDRIRNGHSYGFSQPVLQDVVRSYAATGFGFAEFDALGQWLPGYEGLCFTSPQWMRARFVEYSQLREIYFSPRMWDNHQDVFGFVK